MGGEGVWHASLTWGWSLTCNHQSAEFLKGTFPEISNISESNWKLFFIFTSNGGMEVKIGSDLLICWLHDIQKVENFKGHS